MRRLIALILLAYGLSFCQQRYLISPTNEVYKLKTGESARFLIEMLNGSGQKSLLQPCTNRYHFGTPTDIFPPNMHIAAHHKDVLGEWYAAPASGTIDTIFWWCNGTTGAKESLVILRYFYSNLGPGYGPGVRPGPFNPPCQNWGYWINTQDADRGVAAFREDAFPDTIWHSTYNGAAVTIPPFPESGWDWPMGLGVINRPGLNSAWLGLLGTPLYVTKGDNFFISLKVNSENRHLTDEIPTVFAGWKSESRVSTSDENYPPHNWYFFEHDSSLPGCGGLPREQVKRGWVALGSMESDSLIVASYNWWYSMTVTSDVPPSIHSIAGGDAHNTFSTLGQTVRYEVYDCNPSHPESAGVALAVIRWSISTDGREYTPMPEIPMSNTMTDYWEAQIPGQSAGTSVHYHVYAKDKNGNSHQGPFWSYTVVKFWNPFYLVDTSYEISWQDIHFSGTPVDTGRFFLSPLSSVKSGKNDGTAGPFDIGADMIFFGDTVRYAWVGVNGAVALSRYITDTLDVNSLGGYFSWDIPVPQHHARQDRVNPYGPPPNFIAPFYADFIIGDATAEYGHLYTGSGGDSCQFIAEWDSLGNYGQKRVLTDVARFRVILNRCDGTIEFQYNDVGNRGQDSLALVGMQQDSSNLSGPTPAYVFINRYGYPLETKPRNNYGIKFYPGVRFFAEACWNLVSVSTVPLDFNKEKVYPGSASDAYRYEEAYVSNPILENGVGYWLKYNGRTYAGVPGYPIRNQCDNVTRGWNIIGTPGKPVPVSSIQEQPPGIVASGYFAWSCASGYILTSELEPGRGYWVKANAAGQLCMSESGSLYKQGLSELEGLNKVIIQGPSGQAQTLYLGASIKKNPAFYAMPPASPDFDARFASGLLVETYPDRIDDKAIYDYPIIVKPEGRSLTVYWDVIKPPGRKLMLKSGGRTISVLEGKGSIRIQNPVRLSIELGTEAHLPRVFALSENYPNPFNPATQFRVDIPRTAVVSILVYDLLGREVVSLMSGEQFAGSHPVEWNGRDSRGSPAPTGIYFFRMTADDFRAVHKVLLMK